MGVEGIDPEGGVQGKNPAFTFRGSGGCGLEQDEWVGAIKAVKTPVKS